MTKREMERELKVRKRVERCDEGNMKVRNREGQTGEGREIQEEREESEEGETRKKQGGGN